MLKTYFDSVWNCRFYQIVNNSNLDWLGDCEIVCGAEEGNCCDLGEMKEALDWFQQNQDL